MDPHTSSQYETWILEAIDRLKNRKARPDLEKISNIVGRNHGVEKDAAEWHLNKMVNNGTVIAVEYKGGVSYRNASKWKRTASYRANNTAAPATGITEAINLSLKKPNLQQLISPIPAVGGSCYDFSSVTSNGTINTSHSHSLDIQTLSAAAAGVMQPDGCLNLQIPGKDSPRIRANEYFDRKALSPCGGGVGVSYGGVGVSEMSSFSSISATLQSIRQLEEKSLDDTLEQVATLPINVNRYTLPPPPITLKPMPEENHGATFKRPLKQEAADPVHKKMTKRSPTGTEFPVVASAPALSVNTPTQLTRPSPGTHAAASSTAVVGNKRGGHAGHVARGVSHAVHPGHAGHAGQHAVLPGSVVGTAVAPSADVVPCKTSAPSGALSSRGGVGVCVAHCTSGPSVLSTTTTTTGSAGGGEQRRCIICHMVTTGSVPLARAAATGNTGAAAGADPGAGPGADPGADPGAGPGAAPGAAPTCLSCRQCGSTVHVACANYSARVLAIIQRTHWICGSCRPCCKCYKGNNMNAKLICGFCDRVYHFACHQPPISRPADDLPTWKCSECSSSSASSSSRRSELSEEEIGANSRAVISAEGSTNIRPNNVGSNTSNLPVEDGNNGLPTSRCSPHTSSKPASRPVSRDEQPAVPTSSASSVTRVSVSPNVPLLSKTITTTTKDGPAAVLPRLPGGTGTDAGDGGITPSGGGASGTSPRQWMKALSPTGAAHAKDWTVDDVAHWLVTQGFPEEARSFYEQDIDGPALLLIRRMDLFTCLGIKLGRAVKIFDRVRRLQCQQQDSLLSQ